MKQFQILYYELLKCNDQKKEAGLSRFDWLKELRYAI